MSVRIGLRVSLAGAAEEWAGVVTALDAADRWVQVQHDNGVSAKWPMSLFLQSLPRDES